MRLDAIGAPHLIPFAGCTDMAKTVKFEGGLWTVESNCICCQHFVVPGVGMTCSGCSGAIERILKKASSGHGTWETTL